MHMKQQQKIISRVSERMTIFTSDRNDSPLHFTTIQVQTILQEIDCISDVRETVKDCNIFWVSGELHHNYFSHNAS